MVKTSFWHLRRYLTWTPSFLGAAGLPVQLHGGCSDPHPQLSRGFRAYPSFLDPIPPSLGGGGFVPAFWVSATCF